MCVKSKISRRSMKLMVYRPLQEEKSLCRLAKSELLSYSDHVRNPFYFHNVMYF